MTQQLAEETPLPLLLHPLDRLQERAPSPRVSIRSQGSLADQEIQVSWGRPKTLDLFINLLNPAQCCLQSLPVAPEPQVHSSCYHPPRFGPPKNICSGSSSGVSPEAAVDQEPRGGQSQESAAQPARLRAPGPGTTSQTALSSGCSGGTYGTR